MAVIKVIAGPGEGDSIFLSDKNTLGRARECDFRIKAAEASRNHAEIVFKNGDYFVRDLNSSNGTFVNEVKITEAKLKDGDEIVISGVKIIFNDERSLTSSAVLEELPPEVEHPKPSAQPEPEPDTAESDSFFPELYRRKAFVRKDILSETYVATDTDMNRLVEVGVINSNYCKNPEDVLKRLKQASQFTHPVLAHLYDVGIVSGQVWFAHEHVSRDMKKISGKLSHAEVADIGAQLSEALALAHSAGVVHGGITPDKILRSDAGRVKLVGLGLPVPQTNDSSVDAMEKMTALTYMAPEQFAGSDPNALCDIYSLGGVLYKLLTGQQPINVEKESDIAKEVASGKVRSIQSARPGSPKKIAQVIEKMMANTPGDRYLSMAEVCAEFKTFAGSAPRETAKSESAAEAPDKKGLGAAGILIFILAAIIVLMAFVMGTTSGGWFIKQSVPQSEQPR